MSNANDNIKLNFDPKHLPRLMPFKAVHDIRYYLNGIYVEKAERGGVYLVATDGHTMAVIHDETGSIEGAEGVTFEVATGLASAAKAAAKRGNASVPYRVHLQNNRAKVSCGDMELFLQPGKCVIEGKFPDWKKVIPPDFGLLKEGLVSPEINISYLARLAKISNDRYHGARFWQQAPDKALVIQMPSVPQMIVLVMPMRGDGGPGKFEAFTFPKKVAEVAPEPVAA
jgi:hypothetical protein